MTLYKLATVVDANGGHRPRLKHNHHHHHHQLFVVASAQLILSNLLAFILLQSIIISFGSCDRNSPQQPDTTTTTTPTTATQTRQQTIGSATATNSSKLIGINASHTREKKRHLDFLNSTSNAANNNNTTTSVFSLRVVANKKRKRRRRHVQRPDDDDTRQQNKNAATFQRYRRATSTGSAHQLKVAALASKLNHWLVCNRFDLLAAGQLIEQPPATTTTTSLSSTTIASQSAAVDSHKQPTQMCAAHFDGHLCWPPTRAGQQARQACPQINYKQQQQQQISLTSSNTSQVRELAKANLQALASTGSGAHPLVDALNEAPNLSASSSFVIEDNKFATRQCADANNNNSTNALTSEWLTPADYSNCVIQQTTGDNLLLFDPTDEWIKLSDDSNHDETKRSDAQLFAHLTQQLERIEISIDPYGEPELLEQWTICIDELVRQHAALQNTVASASTSSSSSSPLSCPIIFDGWRCWPATRAGEIAYVNCPSNQPGFSAERKAYKICTLAGDWYRHPMTNKYWSNYTTCVDTVDLAFRTKILNLYVIGNLISLIALSISLVIFVSFKSLNCTRVTIHKNLFLSFITNNLMWIVWYTCVVNDADLLQSNPASCRVWHILLHYFLVSNYFWMFCEGLYLHTLLVVAFVSEDKILKWFYLLGWLTPVPITLAYAYNRSYDEYYTNFCWMEESPHNIILMAPIGCSLLLNLIFLINIVRVLVTKLRANNSPDTHQTRKAVRATLILIPLLGLHYMLTPFRPEAKSEWEVIYEIIAAVCTSFQGLCVAMLFCFCNAEVICVIKKYLKDTCLIERSDNDSKRALRSRSNTAISQVAASGGCTNALGTPSSITHSFHSVAHHRAGNGNSFLVEPHFNSSSFVGPTTQQQQQQRRDTFATMATSGLQNNDEINKNIVRSDQLFKQPLLSSNTQTQSNR